MFSTSRVRRFRKRQKLVMELSKDGAMSSSSESDAEVDFSNGEGISQSYSNEQGTSSEPRESSSDAEADADVLNNEFQATSSRAKPKCRKKAKKKAKTRITNESDDSLELSSDSSEVLSEISDHDDEFWDLLPIDTDLSEYEGDSDSHVSSESGESNTEENEQEEPDLKEKLRSWAVRNHCTRNTVNEILKIMNQEGLPVPLDMRTLLETMSNVPVISKAGGQYFYFGVGEAIKRNMTYVEEDIARIKISIDGIPIYSSKGSSLWPISVTINKSSPAAVALWYGKSKPSSTEDYLRDLINECKVLLREGLNIQDRVIEIIIFCFVCDAPARAYLKGIVNPSGYHSCERCTIHGEWLSNRIVFNKREKTSLRTDEEMLELKYSRGAHPHQHYPSPLAELNIGLVSCFVLDFMHLVCLGVVRRLLRFLTGAVSGTRCGKLSSSMINEVNNGPSGLLSIRLPSEFNRQPRSLDDLAYWKATELRSFVLYSGMVVLRKVLKRDQYKHFLSLSISMRLLCESCEPVRNSSIEHARSLLEYFVWNAHLHYGPLFNVYTVHGLIHVPDDVASLGLSLDEISAFPFENYLGWMKRLCRGKLKPVVQITKRLDEWYRSSENETKAIPRKVNTEKDSWFQINSGYFHVLEVRDNIFHGMFYKDSHLKSFFTHFVDSRDIGIVVLNPHDNGTYKDLKKCDFIRKCVCIPYKNSVVIVPLLNDFND